MAPIGLYPGGTFGETGGMDTTNQSHETSDTSGDAPTGRGAVAKPVDNEAMICNDIQENLEDYVASIGQLH